MRIIITSLIALASPAGGEHPARPGIEVGFDAARGRRRHRCHRPEGCWLRERQGPLVELARKPALRGRRGCG